MDVDFSGISNKRLFGKVLRLPLKLIPPRTVLPILQGRLKGKLWIAGSSYHGCWLGSYEYEERRLFEKTINRGKVVLDIGAHVGFYTLLASVLVGEEGKVFSFEPVPRNLFYLKKHLRINRISNVTVIEKAVSNINSTAFFISSSSTAGQFQRDANLQVETVSLDELVSKQIIPKPDYMKIDVEGAEFLVLSGAENILIDSKPTIFLATHGIELHHKCCDFLKLLNYELRTISIKAVETTDTVIAYKHEQ